MNSGESPANLHNVIQQVMSQQNPESAKKWTERCEEALKQIKGMKPKDRLEFATAISDIIYHLTVSIKGWRGWYNAEFFTPLGRKPLSELTEEQWKHIFEVFKEVAVALYNLDIEITKPAEEKMEKTQKKREKKKTKKERYVS